MDAWSALNLAVLVLTTVLHVALFYWIHRRVEAGRVRTAVLVEGETNRAVQLIEQLLERRMADNRPALEELQASIAGIQLQAPDTTPLLEAHLARVGQVIEDKIRTMGKLRGGVDAAEAAEKSHTSRADRELDNMGAFLATLSQVFGPQAAAWITNDSGMIDEGMRDAIKRGSARSVVGFAERFIAANRGHLEKMMHKTSGGAAATAYTRPPY